MAGTITRPGKLVVGAEGGKTYGVYYPPSDSWSYASIKLAPRKAAYWTSLGYTGVLVLEDEDEIANWLGLSTPLTSAADFSAMHAAMLAHGFDEFHRATAIRSSGTGKAPLTTTPHPQSGLYLHHFP